MISGLFGLKLQKYMISGGRKGAAFLFLKECILGNHFQSLFCQILYVGLYMILGQGGPETIA